MWYGSNQNLVEMAARLVVLDHPEVLGAAAFYLASPEGLATVERVRSSAPGGMAHACEVDEQGYPAGDHAWMDWVDGPLKLMPWWSSFSDSGVQGEPTKASADKGAVLLEAAVAECGAYVRELLDKPLPRRRSPA
jgi:creatinine amidohydrolase/Fe(II)-dependent formamide hydrolase-like protein